MPQNPDPTRQNNGFDDLVQDNGAVQSPTQHTQQVPPKEPVRRVDPQTALRDETYTEEEQSDVNNITVTISDDETPIVVFFGSPASGKTMTLLRMIRYLQTPQSPHTGHNYVVEADPLFRPKSDKHYERMCKGLQDMAYSKYAPGATDVISFMLVKVLDTGSPVCQILEAPGEHYFDGTGNMTFPTYIDAIRLSPNRKIWVFFVEQDWGDTNERQLYSNKIRCMQNLISEDDDIVFLINQVDKKRLSQYDKGKPMEDVFLKNVTKQYPGIFDKYKRTGRVERFLFGENMYKTVCFSSGVYSPTADGKREVWTPESDWYCQGLWEAINK